MNEGILIGLLFLIIISVGLYIGYSSEKKDWNNGVSPIGKKWKRFDTDSQGGRGYTDNCGNYCWISYPGIDKNYKSKGRKK